MRFIHRIGFRATDGQRQTLQELGVQMRSMIAMPGGGNPLVSFDVAEDHPRWSRIRALLQEWGKSEGDVITEFSKQEIEAARWLEIAAWHHGYPQPRDDEFGYRVATYDLTDWCEPCGIGMKQRASFQMKREPKWGRRGIYQLIWVYDELFVKPEVWAGVFEPRGIHCRSVTNTRGAELSTVVQLVIDEEVAIATEGLAFETCQTCGRSKLSPAIRGFFPAPLSEPRGAMARTREYFGSGGQADKRVLISQDLARALAAASVRGASFTPVAELR